MAVKKDRPPASQDRRETSASGLANRLVTHAIAFWSGPWLCNFVGGIGYCEWGVRTFRVFRIGYFE